MNCDDTQTDHIEYMGQKRGPNNTYVHDFEVRSKYFCLTKPQECTFIAKNQRFDLSSLRSNYETWTAYDTRPGKYKRPCHKSLPIFARDFSFVYVITPDLVSDL